MPTKMLCRYISSCCIFYRCTSYTCFCSLLCMCFWYIPRLLSFLWYCARLRVTDGICNFSTGVFAAAAGIVVLFIFVGPSSASSRYPSKRWPEGRTDWPAWAGASVVCRVVARATQRKRPRRSFVLLSAALGTQFDGVVRRRFPCWTMAPACAGAQRVVHTMAQTSAHAARVGMTCWMMVILLTILTICIYMTYRNGLHRDGSFEIETRDMASRHEIMNVDAARVENQQGRQKAWVIFLFGDLSPPASLFGLLVGPPVLVSMVGVCREQTVFWSSESRWW